MNGWFHIYVGVYDDFARLRSVVELLDWTSCSFGYSRASAPLLASTGTKLYAAFFNRCILREYMINYNQSVTLYVPAALTPVLPSCPNPLF
jgi:hypothetical protein